ncbi:hypothetical protein QR680_014567 [Steinernema hermaphroditum]|uniref:MULE transposase domain-containing protein n=1 Tax=Steinernema hermaphroditum TaxID=289476 RepID=A0AA39M4A2_9BILA|nr:hypothetical protein QR680_014567 [Steinernema hermaphroditum]
MKVFGILLVIVLAVSIMTGIQAAECKDNTERSGYVFPVLTALLPNKAGSTYEALFRMIHQKWPEFKPESMSIDFEKAAFNAANKIFPEIRILGCLFHLAQNFKKQFTGHLLRRYNTEPDFAVEARKILALAFVKPEDLDRAVCELSESWEEVEHRGEDDGEDLITTDLSVLEPVLKWFEDNYMGKVDRRGNRRSPQFAVDMWNCHDRVLKNDPRTNNRAEAAHRRLQRELGADHPSIWKFIESLRKVQIGVDKSFEDMLIGRPAEQKRKKYRDADLRIRRLVDGYDEDNLLDFLHGIATNIGMS